MSLNTNAELADIHFKNGVENEIRSAAVHLHGERHSTWRQSNHQTFAQGVMKRRVYGTPVNSEIDLVARISIVTATIHETPGIFEHVSQPMSR
ncbi:hypothetical protein TNCV_785921 [Trichonephila clavipes]|nr:hypothetical protein TNCV_785921 [Trichonephila clavipes]